MTYYLLLLPGLVVVVLGLVVRRRAAAWGQGLLLAGCAICLGAFGWQVRQSFYVNVPKVPSRANTVVGYRFAMQLQAMLAGRTGKVVVLLPASLSAEAAESTAGAFSAPLLRGHPELSVEVVRLESPKHGASSPAVDGAAFKHTLEKFADALAFVSYAGVPADMEKLFTAAPPRGVLLVYDPDGSANWLTPLKQKLILTVVVPRPDVDAAAAAGIAGLPGDIFDQLYWQATSPNADVIAARLSARR